MANTYDRYNLFRKDGEIEIVPFIKIPVKSSDINITYKKNETRLDLVSYKYYGNADYAWLIMQANPSYGSMEFEIPDGAILRIPYPLEATIEQYIADVNQHKTLN